MFCLIYLCKKFYCCFVVYVLIALSQASKRKQMIINTMEKINDSYEEVGYPEIKFGAFNSQSIKCYSSRHCFAVYIMEFEDSLSLVNEASTDQTLLVHEDSMT